MDGDNSGNKGTRCLEAVGDGHEEIMASPSAHSLHAYSLGRQMLAAWWFSLCVHNGIR